MPTPLAIQYCTQDDVDALLSADGVNVRLDDDGSGTVSPTELTYLTTWAVNLATARVNMYCLGLYNAADLAQSWMVNHYATVIAARYLAMRRLNPCPESLLEMFKDVMSDLWAIKSQKLFFNDIASRNVEWPAWSNVRVDPRYWLRQIRVERPISEKTPTTGYSQTPDIQADVIFEY